MRVVICDDDPAIRVIVADMAEVRGYQVVGQADGAADVITAVREGRPDVVILDLAMPGMSGIDAIPLILAESPGCQVMVFTAHDDQHSAALAAGAKDSFAKTDLLRLDRVLRAWHPVPADRGDP